MLELVSAFSLLGSTRILLIAFNIFRTKIFSSILGPFGIGIFAQATTFVETFQVFNTLGIGGGFLKQAADYSGRRDYSRLYELLVFVITGFGLLGVLSVIVSLFYTKQISKWVFDTPHLDTYIYVVALAGLVSVQASVALLILQATLRWKEFFLVSILGGSLSLFAGSALVISASVNGAIYSIFISSVINLSLGILYLRKAFFIPNKINLRFVLPRRDVVFTLLGFVGVLAITALISNLSVLYIRSEIIRQLGIVANGYYQVIWSTRRYISIISGALWSYGMPKVATLLHSPREIVKLQNDEMRLAILVLTPAMIFLTTFRRIWIPVLFSVEFLPAAKILVWQLAGDFLLALRYSVNIVLLPFERKNAIFVFGLSFWGGWSILSTIMIRWIGIAGVPISYFMINLFLLVPTLIYHYSTTEFRISRSNWILLIKVVPLLLAAVFLAQYETIITGLILPTIILIILIIWMPSRKEFEQLLVLVKDWVASLYRVIESLRKQ